MFTRRCVAPLLLTALDQANSSRAVNRCRPRKSRNHFLGICGSRTARQLQGPGSRKIPSSLAAWRKITSFPPCFAARRTTPCGTRSRLLCTLDGKDVKKRRRASYKTRLMPRPRRRRCGGNSRCRIESCKWNTMRMRAARAAEIRCVVNQHESTSNIGRSPLSVILKAYSLP